MKVDKQDIKIIRTLISKAGMDEEDKEALVSEYTKGRSTSTKELLKVEARELIGHLKNASPSLNPSPKGRDFGDPRSQRMKRKIFAMCHEMGWHIEGTRKLDMQRLNNWCEKSSLQHKKLDRYAYEDLPALVSQFEKVYKSYLDYLKK